MRARRRAPRPRTGERLRRGVYLIPSLFTVANIFVGFYSLVATARGDFETAAVLILIAVVADSLDGRIARLTHTTSSFGEAYDSLADVLSFGAAPALLAYKWGLWQKPRLGLAVAFLFLVGGSIRLARFNSQAKDPSFFKGMPIPAGAAAVALIVLESPAPVQDPAFLLLVAGFVLALALLMVSTLPYRSFKDFNLRRRLPVTIFFAIATVFALLTFAPIHVMSLLLVVYILSAPLAVLMRTRSRGDGASPVAEEAPTEEIL